MPALSAFRYIPDSPRRPDCAGTFAGKDVRTWAGSLHLIQIAAAEGAKPGRGGENPGRSGSFEFAEIRYWCAVGASGALLVNAARGAVVEVKESSPTGCRLDAMWLE